MTDTCSRTAVLMDTLVSIEVVASESADDCRERVDRAFEWFRRVEACCSRFDPTSEVMQLTARAGVPVRVSPLLYEAVRFAMAVARQSGGAFDPTVGHTLEARGFNRDYRTGQTIVSALGPGSSCTYKDVRLDPDRRAITLCRPLILDLGAVAKGLAVDLAAQELRPFAGYAIDAGGDLYVRGRNAAGERWRVGIRHPRQDGEVIEVLRLSDVGVCTSGDYERRGRDGGHHIVDPHTGESTDAVASVTVVAPTTMLADALGTAAFVLGPARGLRLLERQGVEGLIISPSLERHATRGFARYLR